MQSVSLIVAALVLASSVGSYVSRAAVDVDHVLFDEVLKKHVTKGEVDYPAIKSDKRFAAYLAAIGNVQPGGIKDEKARLAFWINTYNAFTIQLVLDHSPVRSIRDITRGETGAWDIVWIAIGGKKYSLNQIEHEILRKEFDEPRVHVALVCAARGCPPLRSEAYVAGMLDVQLEDNGKAFVADRSKNRYDPETNTLLLSELFRWYGGDFVRRYGSPQQFVLNLLGLTGIKPPAVSYLPYDWSLNSKQ